MTSVLVADAGFLPTTRQMGLAAGDQLGAYLTPVWAGRVPRLARLPRIGRELRRRELSPSLERHVSTAGTVTELARVALLRLGARRLNYDLLWQRNARVDQVAAERVNDHSCVVTQYTAAIQTLLAARAAGCRSILDYPTVWLDAARRLLDDEARLRPEFADTITGQLALEPLAHHKQQIADEVEAAEIVVAGSAFAAGSLADAFPGLDVRAIPYGTDTRVFAPAHGRAADAGGPLRVLFVGYLAQHKGIAYLLDAFKLLDPKRFSLTLVGQVVGSGRGLAAYEGLYRWIPRVPHTAMPAVYREADVLVLPSLVEGSAVSVLEALSSGLPAIVTPNAGADAVRDGSEGFVVPIRSAEAIASRLELLERQRGKLAAMSTAARERAVTFDWAHFRTEFASTVLDVAPLAA